jgi:predicted nucleic-acid-binding protein
MHAIDTNLVVRYLTKDHPNQSARAKALIDNEAVFVATTVLLETEWVLRGAYGYTTERVAGALRAFAGHPNVVLENAQHASQALDWMAGGMDFADALHLSGARECASFVTFDQGLAKAANRMGITKVRAL